MSDPRYSSFHLEKDAEDNLTAIFQLRRPEKVFSEDGPPPLSRFTDSFNKAQLQSRLVEQGGPDAPDAYLTARALREMARNEAGERFAVLGRNKPIFDPKP